MKAQFFRAMTVEMMLGVVLVCGTGGVVLAQEPDAAPQAAEATMDPVAGDPESAPMGGLGGLGVASADGADAASIVEPDDARQEMIFGMVRDVCSTCHGVDLVGDKGPALSAETLKGKDVEVLAETIANGKLGTIMPPFGAMLSREETRWLAHRLQQGLKKP